jgi:hypothetical protein
MVKRSRNQPYDVKMTKIDLLIKNLRSMPSFGTDINKQYQNKSSCSDTRAKKPSTGRSVVSSTSKMSSNTPIPTSTAVLESAVIKAPLAKVWHHIKLQDFSTFWSALSKSEWLTDADPEAQIVKWTFKDGTVLEVKQEEHSVSQQPQTSNAP